MKALGTIAAALALAACSRTAPPSAAEAKAPSAAKAPEGVTLDDAAQRGAGIRVEPAAERAIPEVVRANARITNDEEQTWRVGAITDGRVVSVLAAPGDVVEEGKALARLHSHEIHDSRALYRNAKSEQQRARAALDYAVKARDRARRLLELKAASQEQVEHAETEARSAEAALTTAGNEVARHRAHLEEFLGVSAEDDGHDDESDRIPVRAPASGTVLVRNVTQGSVVSPANDLFIISNLDSLWAIAEVSEEHLRQLRPGMPARIYVQAWEKEPFSGRIAKLGESLDPQTRTIKVRVAVPNKGRRLKPEMYATAEIDVGASRKAIFVVSEAAQEIRGQTVVFVRTGDKRFEARPVETGRAIDGALEIVRGLRAGEMVAVRGAFVLKSEYLKSTLADE
jgi:RND family efflux transporter MFP subunit